MEEYISSYKNLHIFLSNQFMIGRGNLESSSVGLFIPEPPTADSGVVHSIQRWSHQHSFCLQHIFLTLNFQHEARHDPRRWWERNIAVER